jgi:hypothetical protein
MIFCKKSKIEDFYLTGSSLYEKIKKGVGLHVTEALRGSFRSDFRRFIVLVLRLGGIPRKNVFAFARGIGVSFFDSRFSTTTMFVPNAILTHHVFELHA